MIDGRIRTEVNRVQDSVKFISVHLQMQISSTYTGRDWNVRTKEKS